MAAVNIIAGSTKIVGNIESDSDFRIDGSLLGNLTTKGRLIVGETGSIKGDVTCQAAEIEGSLQGKIKIENLLIFRPTAKFNGEIETSQLQIEPGAIFNGVCKMGKTTDNK